VSGLSDGDGADGKGVTQEMRSENQSGGRRRKRRTRRPSRKDSPTGNVAHKPVGEERQDHSLQPAGNPRGGNGSKPNKIGNRGIRPRKFDSRSTGRRSNSAPVYAALDLGTNNCRLLMAIPRPRGRFRVIEGFSRIVRLGEGLSQSGNLGDAAMDRAVEALKICASKLDNRKIRRKRLIATEACRQAGNGEVFLERVLNETGLELEIVNRQTEARLAAEGCGVLMDRNCDAAVMFDIGGGSTELIIVSSRKPDKRRIRDRIEAWTSLPMGVVTLAEKFGGQEVTPERFDEMKAFVQTEIDGFIEEEGENLLMAGQNIHLLGTSGTVTTLAGIHLGLARYERKRVDGLWLSSNEIDIVINQLLEMDYEARRLNPCIGSERADLVLAGCAILEAIRETWPTEKLRVADRGLREGLLTEMMYADKVWRRKRSKPRNNPNGAEQT